MTAISREEVLGILYRFAQWAKDRDDREFTSQLHGQICRIENLPASENVMSIDEVASRILAEADEQGSPVRGVLEQLAAEFCAPPPMPELQRAYPVVLFLRTERDRQELMAAALASNPNLKVRPL